MSQDYKILAQLSPLATTISDLYTVPAETQSVISTLAVSNRSSSVVGSYRIAVIPNEETLSDKHYIAFDVELPVSEVSNLTFGMTLAAGDKIVVYASNANINFNVFGVEFS